MTMNIELIAKIINVTSKAATSSYKFLGKQDKENDDKDETE